MLPHVAVPTYWVFGRAKFQGYVSARRDENLVLWQPGGVANRRRADFRELICRY